MYMYILITGVNTVHITKRSEFAFNFHRQLTLKVMRFSISTIYVLADIYWYSETISVADHHSNS